MAISTVRGNEPESRIVLLKEITDNGLVFYSNYNSAKGKSLRENPKISVPYFWREQERQVRINGKVVSKISKQEQVHTLKKAIPSVKLSRSLKSKSTHRFSKGFRR